MVYSVWFAAILAAFFGASAGQHQNDQATVPTLGVCEALTRASEYDGKMVRIRGQVSSTEEGTWYIGDDCRGTFVSDGKVWPSSIAWTSPDNKEFILHPITFSFDKSSLTRLDKKWVRLRKQLSDRCIAVTYTGMFEMWSRDKARKMYPGGKVLEIPGFGHLNGSPTQLVLKSADEVVAIPNCKKQ